MPHYPADLTADVIVPADGALHVIQAVDAWFRLKEHQRLENGDSARIDWTRADRLVRAESYLPEAEAARTAMVQRRAHPRISEACARAKAALFGDGGLAQ